VQFSTGVFSVRLGLVLSACAIVIGFAAGGVFGIAEDAIKADLLARASASSPTDEAGRQLADKSWVYLKRAHMHWGGVGTATLCLALLAGLVPQRRWSPSWAAAAAGIGAVAYPAAWSAAGLLAPSEGSTAAAKSLLAPWFIGSAALVLIGSVALLVMAAASLYGASDERAPLPPPLDVGGDGTTGEGVP
jgi:hypothetical protein